MSDVKDAHGPQEGEEITGKETSILFEPLTIGIFIVCLLLAIWFKMFTIIAVLTFLLLLSLFIVIWKSHSLKNVYTSLHVPKTRLFQGGSFTVNASIQNKKWLPLVWLEWEFPTSSIVQWEQSNTNTYTTRLLWLLPFAKVHWSITGEGMKRGVYNIGDIVIRSGDGFRFTEKEKICNNPHEIFIYPQLVPICVPVFQPSLQWEVTGKRGGMMEDPLIISGIREYEVGDEWRRINWKASARTGKLLTNEYEPITTKKMYVYIDVRDFQIDDKRYENELLKQKQYEQEKVATFEMALSLLASFIVAYQEQGIAVGYMSNGLSYKDKRQPVVKPWENRLAILDQLAQLTMRLNKEKDVSLKNLLHHIEPSVPLFIFCNEITKAHYKLYEKNRQTYDMTFYYVKETAFSKKMESRAKQIDELRVKKKVTSR